MSGTGDDSEDAGFELEGMSGSAFEAALQEAERALSGPLPKLRLVANEPDEDDDPVDDTQDALAAEDDDSVALSLTLAEGALVGEFSGADGLQAATPAELPADSEDGFQEIPRSGSEAIEGDPGDWLEPEESSAWREAGGLTGQAEAVLLSDFSGAEDMPQAPALDEPEEEGFEHEDLLSVTAGDTIAEPTPLPETEDLEALDEDDAQMTALAELIFSADPRAAKEELPRVTARTEPEFSFKR